MADIIYGLWKQILTTSNTSDSSIILQSDHELIDVLFPPIDILRTRKNGGIFSIVVSLFGDSHGTSLPLKMVKLVDLLLEEQELL